MIALPITEASQAGDARRRALAIARDLGLGETAAGRVGIVATELATNLLKFGVAGELLLGTFEDGAGEGVELIALDKGPGIADVGHVMRDGRSSVGTAGDGLGAVRRLSRCFDIVSWAAVGTAVLARVGEESGPVPEAAEPAWGAVVVPLRGEAVSGDAIRVRADPDGWTIFAADGLGHGPQAALAAEEAVRLFLMADREPLPVILKGVHEGLRHTRGAAVAVCRYRADEDSLRFAGVGNISARIVTGADTRRLVSHDGTAGVAARRIQEFTYALPRGGVLVMHSDGLTTSWSSAPFPSLFAAHPSLAAGVLYRHCARGRDDASVVVARARRPAALVERSGRP